MPDEQTYIYGPVPSRRLGRSLGLDIVPFKTCTLDCVYCQLGRTTCHSSTRSNYTPIDRILSQLEDRIREGLQADFITIGGSGEPTLHKHIGTLIKTIKTLTPIPVAVLTNGTLFYRPDVRQDCSNADVVIPSLDAPNQQLFERINRPTPNISIKKLVDGLAQFRREFWGQIWLEIFIIPSLNTAPEHIAGFKTLIQQIHPDKVHLNTAVRPTAEPDIRPASTQQLEQIARQLGPNCEPIAEPSISAAASTASFRQLLAMLKRRPCSVQDICSVFNITPHQAQQLLHKLQQTTPLRTEKKGKILFYRAL